MPSTSKITASQNLFLTGDNDEETNKCLNEIDVLVDGRFVEEKKDPTLKFRGSSNQRILDLKPSLQTHKFIEYKL